MEAYFDRSPRTSPPPVERLLADAGITLPDGIRLSPLSGGFQNWNFVVRDGGNPFVLRFSKSSEALRKEVALLISLEREGSALPVPTVLWSRPQDDDLSFAAFSFMPGTMLWGVRSRLDGWGRGAISFRLGGLLAQIHAHKYPRFGFLKGDLEVESPAESYSDWTAHYMRSYLDSPRFRAHTSEDLRRRLMRCIDAYPEFHLPESDPCLCHGDFNEKNILVDIDARAHPVVTAILDWEFSLVSTPALDIGNLFRFSFLEPWIDAASFEHGYLGGGGALAADWRARACFIDLIALCDFLDSEDSRPKTEETARKVIDASLAFLLQNR